MNEKCKEEKFKTIYEAFECFKESFLLNGKSIFTGNEILTKVNLDVIISGFIKNPDESNKSFDEKIRIQIGEKEEVKELFAHAIWLWGIFASDMRPDSKVKNVSKWLAENTYTEKSKFSFDHGIGSTGQYHKNNKALELVYIINFFEKIIENKNNQPINFIEIIKDLKQNIKNKVSMYNILLHLFAPNDYARIASYGHKEKLVQFFEPIFKLNDDEKYKKFNTDTDAKIKMIEEKCREKFKKKISL